MTRNQIDPEFEAVVQARLRSYADGAPTLVREVNDLQPVTAAPVPKRRIIGIGASVIALAGGLTLTGIAATGGEDRGSNTPEEAVREFVEAIENRDVLGALDVIDPGESDVMIDTVRSLVSEGSRTGALSDSADAGDVTGTTFTFTDLEMTTDQLTTDLAAVSVDAGTLQYSFDPATLPLADAMRSEAGDALAREGATIDFANDPLRLATVSRDGTWYVSLGYSIAEAARASADVPFPIDVPTSPQGFESPEAAATAFWTRLAALDIEGVIATAAPGEADALARYAPLWLPDLNAGIADATASGTSITVSDLAFDVSGDGDRRRVTPTNYVIEGTLPPASDDGFPVYDPEQPTMVWSANGSGFYLLDAGEPVPDNFDDIELLEDFPEELMTGDVTYNSASMLPDGSVQQFWTEVSTTDDQTPRPFRLEYADSCTITSGALIDDTLRWGPAANGLEDLGDGRYRACGEQTAVGSFSVLAVVSIGRSGFATPEVPAIQTVEIDGQWYVAPIGTIGEQLIDLLASVPDGAILRIDSPLAIFIYGTDLGILETQLVGRPISSVGTACEQIVVSDDTGNVTEVLSDATRGAVQACAESEEYWNGDTGTDSATSSDVVVAVDIGADFDTDPVASTPND